jgi:hypothetical protein
MFKVLIMFVAGRILIKFSMDVMSLEVNHNSQFLSSVLSNKNKDRGAKKAHENLMLCQDLPLPTLFHRALF